ncbi:MAG: mechanosensitive ion channel domain-containing protein [Bacteroidota bacterium]
MDLLLTWQEAYPITQVGISLIVFILYAVLRTFVARIVARRASSHSFHPARTDYIKRVIRMAALIFLIIALGIVWEISLKGLSVYLASFLAVGGVALFATWSVISNITASVILFFFFPFRVGSKVKIVDGDNSVEGEVVGLSLFSIRIKKEDGYEVYYPNNLAIQKSIIYLG